MCALSDLPVGALGQVDSLENLPDGIASRMISLGFAPGAEVSKVRRAPLGDPTIYRVADAEICLRNSEAKLIEVAQR